MTLQVDLTLTKSLGSVKSMSSIQDLTVNQLRQAILIKEEIALLEGRLAVMMSGGGEIPGVPNIKIRKKYKMSRAGRAAIAAGAKARWSKFRSDTEGPAPKRRGMSAATKKKMAAAAKARWAAAKAAGKSRL